MRVVLQRVSEASVEVNEKVIASINTGILVLVAFEEIETEEEMLWIIGKIQKLRIFPDEDRIMNLSLNDVSGELLIVSQFTLFAQTKKGNRPSYIKSAKPDLALSYYKRFLELLNSNFNGKIASGQFGADMKVRLLNDGPVTISLDSKHKE